MEVLETKSDALLWKQFKHGDGSAFAKLFRQYYTPLLNYGSKFTKQENLVEDCIQELFMDLWRGGGKADVQSVDAYLFCAFKFNLIKLVNKTKAIALVEDMDSIEFQLSPESILIDNEINEFLKMEMYKAFECLTPRQKEIIYLRVYQNLNYETVSELMEINYQAARNLFFKAISVLKKTVAAPTAI